VKKRIFAIFFLIIPTVLFCDEKPIYLSSHHYQLFNPSKFTIYKPQQTEPTYKSTGPAFLKSLLLPGWGQLATGANTRARSFIVAEGLLWSSFASFQIYSHLKRNDLENFAVQSAGVQGTGKEKTFYTDVSNFIDIYEHNEEMRRFRRYDDVYPIDEEHFWQWGSVKDQNRFDEFRLSAEKANRNSTLILGAIIANHIISGIDAIFVARGKATKIGSHVKLDPSIAYSGDVHLSLSFSTTW
jgi:hypothetical protein